MNNVQARAEYTCRGKKEMDFHPKDFVVVIDSSGKSLSKQKGIVLKENDFSAIPEENVKL